MTTQFVAHTTWMFDIIVNRKKSDKFDSSYFEFFCQIKINLDSYALAFALAESICEEIHRIDFKDTDEMKYNVYPMASKFWNMSKRI